ncbi:hypothetical protein N8T08_000738 [Aspergillus melleus]|uniref:Uncharacterized protein n=1 Tax=Aspergillus melleus TaxID=138277 RepID=A0ACC3AP94_9EURO|nr:hypothetical protein N8T08_000738 [Aspergillus melleus]
MSGILALSALHISRDKGDDLKPAYIRIASTRQDEALSVFRELLPGINTATAKAVFAFSAIIVVYSFAFPHTLDSSDPWIPINELCQVIVLARGAHRILMQASDLVRDSIFSPLLRWDSSRVALPDDAVAAFGCLRSANKRLVLDDPQHEPITYYEAIDCIQMSLEEASTQALCTSAAQRAAIKLPAREAFTTVDSIEAAARRLDHLVGAVQSMQLPATKQTKVDNTVASNPVGFGVPRCLGWIAPEGSELDVIELVYEYPQDTTQRPVSLHMLLLRRLQSSDRPSLGARFKLAIRLAHYYASFISVGYFHKGLHSHNVFFFNDTLDPYIVGCTESRPEIISQNPSPLSDAIEDRELYVPWETVMAMEETDPSKRTRWSAAADIYCLGVMLVETGRWSCASEAWNATSLYDFRRTILPRLIDELGYQMGDICRT